MTTATMPARPAIGEWCELTRGFWTGGRYATAGDLRPGDVFRWGTYTGKRVRATRPAPGPDGPVVWLELAGHLAGAVYGIGTLVELTGRGGDSWPARTADGWPLGLHGPGLSAAPCPRQCGHPLGAHGAHGCEHFAAGHDNGRRVTLHGCACSVPWHGGVS